MNEYLAGPILLIVFTAPVLLAVNLLPALLTGLLCGWRMQRISIGRGLAAGLATGALGVLLVAALMIANWNLQLYLIQGVRIYDQNPAPFAEYFLAPFLSAGLTWAVCRFLARRQASSPPGRGPK